MNTEEALNFLASHKYMSIDEPKDVIDKLEEVRKYFVKFPDERCIPHFLEVFGDHMGWGIYQLCDEVFNKYSCDKKLPYLKKYLKSTNKGTRWWAAHWSLSCPNPELTDELISISQSDEDTDAHYFSLAILGEIYAKNRDKKIEQLLIYRKAIENDPELKELLSEFI